MKMKNNLLALLMIVAGFATLPTSAAEPLQEEFLAALKSKSSHVETITCDFKQVKHNSMLAEDAQSRGEFYFKRPSMLTLRYEAPAGDRIVMGDSFFMVVAGGARNVVKIASNPFYQQLQEIFAACFSGDIAALSSNGDFRCEKREESYTVHIVPQSKRARRYISEVVLVFSERDMLLDELRMDEPTGNYTLYRFKHKEINRPVDDSLFDCNK